MTSLSFIDVQEAIDYHRPRLTRNLADAFFPVGMEDVYIKTNGRERRCRERAIVDLDRDKVFSIVTDNYHLITNEEAYRLASPVVDALFYEFSLGLDDLECFNIKMPQSRSFCHIDLTAEKARFQPVGQGDSWMPFIRITNSYNRTYSLSFDIGFCRAICQNGMIFGKKSVQIKETHSGRIHDLVYRNLEKIQSFRTMAQEVTRKLQLLQECPFPEDKVLPLFCKLFCGRDKLEKATENRAIRERLISWRLDVESRTRAYYSDSSPSAYTVLNILTDYATHSSIAAGGVKSYHGSQAKVTEWADEFISVCRDANFTIDGYLGEEALDAAERMRSLERFSFEDDLMKY